MKSNLKRFHSSRKVPKHAFSNHYLSKYYRGKKKLKASQEQPHIFSDSFIKVLYETTFDWFQEWSFHTGLTVNSSIHTLNTSNFRIAQPEKVYYRDTLRCIQSDVHTLAQFKTFSTCGKSHPQNQLLMCFSSLFNPFLKIKMSSLLSITGTQTIYIYIYIHTYIHTCIYVF